jgi:hypothetical protein
MPQPADPETMSYREMQRACKARGLKGSGKAADLKARLLAAPNIDTPVVCAVCLCVPPAGQGGHRCGTCAAGAWVVCRDCDAQLEARQQSCPICRSDYARPVPEWDSLSPNVCTIRLSLQPSQQELEEIARRFSRLETLAIAHRIGEEPPRQQLNFATTAFPSLKVLHLNSISVRSITFTATNTPQLESLSLFQLSGDCAPFFLELPRLKTLNVQHVDLSSMREQDVGQFGLSLSRCPSLERVTTYKLWGLGADNYCVLPRLESLNMHRADCLEELDILWAPKLQSVNLQSCSSLRHFRLRNAPSTVSTVEQLIARTRQARVHAEEAAWAEARRWGVGCSLSGREVELILRENYSWIGFNHVEDEPGMEDAFRRWLACSERRQDEGERYFRSFNECLGEHLDRFEERERTHRRAAVLRQHIPPSVVPSRRAANAEPPPSSVPCEVEMRYTRLPLPMPDSEPGEAERLHVVHGAAATAQRRSSRERGGVDMEEQRPRQRRRVEVADDSDDDDDADTLDAVDRMYQSVALAQMALALRIGMPDVALRIMLSNPRIMSILSE